MPPEIAALIDKPLLLALILAFGSALGIGVERIMSVQRRAAWKRRNVWRWKKKPGGNVAHLRKAEKQPPTDSVDQLRTVMKAHFSIQPLLNKSEARLFQELDRLVIARNPGWQVMAQVSLGEMLRCKERHAYACINSKRVDLVLMDDQCHARHAIEYQGGGHYLTDAAARDAVKKEALRKAGIGYHEVVSGHTTLSDLKTLVEKLVPSA